MTDNAARSGGREIDRAQANALEVVERGDATLALALLAEAVGLLAEEVQRLRNMAGPRELAQLPSRWPGPRSHPLDVPVEGGQ